jgi:hypothetical protein
MQKSECKVQNSNVFAFCILHSDFCIQGEAGAAGIEPAHSGLTDRRLTIRLHTPVRKKTAGLAPSLDAKPAVKSRCKMGQVWRVTSLGFGCLPNPG